MGPDISQSSDGTQKTGPGGRAPTHEVFELVYQQLRELAHAKMSHEPEGHTLQTTALVHEAYLRLQDDGSPKWDGPHHFFAAAAEAMRRILVERARRHTALKRGGHRARVDLDRAHAAAAGGSDPTDLLAMLELDQALDELKNVDERLCQVVMLRYFAGLSVEATAAALDSSPRTVKRDWAVARAWLARRLSGEDAGAK